jgi:hypothetical protein
MQTGKLPDNWKKANVTPLHKKGPKNLVENYRPISLTSIVCKTVDFFLLEIAFWTIWKNTNYLLSISMDSEKEDLALHN